MIVKESISSSLLSGIIKGTVQVRVLDPKLPFNLTIARRNLEFIKRRFLLLIALIGPILEYAPIVWAPSYECDIECVPSEVCLAFSQINE
uniref:Uncharacterized protein n=1 Tax=Glossina palpalis gambiensis TaxID=67801 RepID=A0A1B0AUX3_9MUSC